MLHTTCSTVRSKSVKQIRARIGEHERRLAQEIGHELKRHELDLIPAQPRRLRRIRQREEHERQHAQHVKQNRPPNTVRTQLKQRARTCRSKNGTATSTAMSGNA